MRGYEARFRVRSGGVECVATIRVIRRSGARAFLDGWTTAVVGPVAVGLRIEPAPTVDADEIATLTSARESGRMTDEGQAFRASHLVGSAEAMEACRFLGDRDARDLASMPGGAAAKGGLDGALAWGLERLRRQSGRMATDAEKAAYGDAMTLALLDVACG